MNPRILVVEDHEQTVAALKRAIECYLLDKQPVVLLANDLAGALHIARARGPLAVCCLDLQLRDSDVENTLRNIPNFGCPVIVMTGSGGSRRDAYRHGAVDFIEKPIVSEVFMDKLTRALQRFNPDSDYSSAAERSQKNIAQEQIELGKISRQARRLMPAAAGIIAVLTFLIGALSQALRGEREKGVTEENMRQHFLKLDTAIEELQRDRRESAKQSEEFRTEMLKKQGRMEKNIVQLLQQQGLQPYRDD